MSYYLIQPIPVFQYTSLFFVNTTSYSSKVCLQLQPEYSNVEVNSLAQKLKLYAARESIASPLDDNSDPKAEEEWHRQITKSESVFYYILLFLPVSWVILFLIVFFINNGSTTSRMKKLADKLKISNRFEVLELKCYYQDEFTLSLAFVLVACAASHAAWQLTKGEITKYYLNDEIAIHLMSSLTYVLLCQDVIVLVICMISICVICGYVFFKEKIEIEERLKAEEKAGLQHFVVAYSELHKDNTESNTRKPPIVTQIGWWTFCAYSPLFALCCLSNHLYYIIVSFTLDRSYFIWIASIYVGFTAIFYVILYILPHFIIGPYALLKLWYCKNRKASETAANRDDSQGGRARGGDPKEVELKEAWPKDEGNEYKKYYGTKVKQIWINFWGVKDRQKLFWIQVIKLFIMMPLSVYAGSSYFASMDVDNELSAEDQNRAMLNGGYSVGDLIMAIVNGRVSAGRLIMVICAFCGCMFLLYLADVFRELSRNEAKDDYAQHVDEYIRLTTYHTYQGQRQKKATDQAITKRSLDYCIDLRGVDVLRKASIEVTNSSGSFHWKEYGLKLIVPAQSLPDNIKICKITVTVSLSGQYKFPKGTELVSPVFCLRCEPNCIFTRLLSLEIEHCALPGNSGSLSMARASSTQKDLPYTFEKLYDGSFSDTSTYGAIALNSFSFFAVIMDTIWQRKYCYNVFEVNFDDGIGRMIHYGITWDDSAHRKNLKDYYDGLKAKSRIEQPIVFTDDAISLDVPEEGTTSGGWKIYPDFPPIIKKSTVDYYRPGRSIPHCVLKARWMRHGQKVEPLIQHIIRILGTTKESSFFYIDISPDQPMTFITENRPSSSELVPPSSLTMKDQPKIRQYLSKLGNQELIEVGSSLGLDSTKLNNKSSSDRFLNDMVTFWLRKDDNVSEQSGTPSWESLCRALEECGYNGIASNIRRNEINI